MMASIEQAKGWNDSAKESTMVFLMEQYDNLMMSLGDLKLQLAQ